MRALDTNVLVYAHRAESSHHEKARRLVVEMAEGKEPWAVPWPCFYEFVRVVTHPRVFRDPSTVEDAFHDVRVLLSSPTLHCLGETQRHEQVLAEVIRETPVTGNTVHDLHIAVLLREHGVTEIVTGDTDFHRFKGLRVTNPFKN